MHLHRLIAAALVASSPGLLPGDAGAWQAASAPQPAFVGAPYAPRPGRTPPGADQLTAIGRAMFFDKSLSANGRVATSSTLACR